MTKRSGQGMTLVELVTVVAMLIILAGVSMPLFNAAITQSRLAGAVQRVANDLRNARSLAVSQGGVYRLHSGDDGTQAGKYCLEQSATGLNPWSALTAWYSLDADYKGAAVASIKDSASNTLYTVLFNAQGASANAGNFPISITITSPGGTKTIQVMRSGNIVVP